MTLRAVRRPGSRTGSIVAVAALLALAIGAANGPARAQDTAAEAHPAHIHAGTCAALGDVVAPLTDVAHATAEASGPASAIPVKSSVTTVDLPLADIVAGGHAINVHESADNIDNYIACGDVGGPVVGDTLTMGLGELNGSGHTGVATLRAMDNQTEVTVHLVEPAEMAAASTEPAGTEAAPAASTSVEIKDFAYNPPTIAIAAGDTVTWTNNDTAPHTATGDGGTFQSGRLDTGQSFSQTFADPGTFDYHCEFHPNMNGVITVS